MILSALSLFLALPLGDPAADTAPPFLLPSTEGQLVGLRQPGVKPLATVVATFRAEDPVSQHYATILQELNEAYSEEGFRFLALMPETSEAAAAFATDCGLDLPVLLDAYAFVAERLGLTHAAAVVVVDPDLRVLYRGALDDRHRGEAKKAAGEDFLLDVLEAVLMEEDVEHSSTEAPGAALRDPGSKDGPTYHENVAPILHQQCAGCHRQGQIGPMALLDYEDARGWAPMIAEVVANGRMPPWHADPQYGVFKNARILDDVQKATLVRWAETGARQGDPAAATRPPVFPADEWEIGTPDLIVELPEEQSVPAEGTIPYRYLVVDPEFKEDRWVQAVEIRPTARDVTHHVICYLLPPGLATRQFLNSPDALGEGLLAGFAPGNQPEVYEDGVAKRIPAGTRFLFEVHYTAVGKPAKDRSRLGLRWASGEVRRQVRTTAILNMRLDIPPGEPAATFHARHRMRENAELLAMTPHMHARGRSFRFERVGADTDEVLLDVPFYDFNWQHTYYLAEPLILEQGETVYLTAVFDNSEDNPFNPDPTARVRWGDQTWDEMMLGWLVYLDTE